MTLLRPEALWLLLVPLALAAVTPRLAAASERRCALFGSRLAREARRRERRRCRRLAGALGLLALALSGPSWGEGPAPVRRGRTDLVLAVDTSPSMAVRDVGGTRLDRARRALIGLLDRYAGGRVGIVVFGREGRRLCPLTSDIAAARSFLESLDPALGEHGPSDLGSGLWCALEQFRDEGRRREVLVVSDGEQVAPPTRLDDALLRAAGLGARVHTAFVGTRSGGMVPIVGDPFGRVLEDEEGRPVVSRGDPERLADLAARGGGRMFDLVAEPFALEEWAADLGDGGGVGRGGRAPIDRYRWALAPALLLLLAPVSVRPLRFRRLRPAAALAAAGVLLASTGLAPGDERAIEEAVRRLRTGDPAGAAEILQALLSGEEGDVPEDPARRVALYDLGVARLALDDPRGAVACFERLLAGPADPTWGARSASAAGTAYARWAQRLSEAPSGRRDPRRRALLLDRLRRARALFVRALALRYDERDARRLEWVVWTLRSLEEATPPGRDARNPDAEQERSEGQAGEGETGRGEAGRREGGEAGQGSPTGGPQRREAAGAASAERAGVSEEALRSIEAIVERYERERREAERARAARRGALPNPEDR